MLIKRKDMTRKGSDTQQASQCKLGEGCTKGSPSQHETIHKVEIGDDHPERGRARELREKGGIRLSCLGEVTQQHSRDSLCQRAHKGTCGLEFYNYKALSY